MWKHSKKSLAFEIVIGVTGLMLMLHYAPISNIPSMYAVEFRSNHITTDHYKLYDFVMLPETANKWMKFVTFVATDHKPVGIGKTYKVVIDSNIFRLAIVEHQQGQYTILETTNEDDVLKMRIEILFTSECYVPCQKLQPRNFVRQLLDLYSFSIKQSGAWEKGTYLNNTTWETERCVYEEYQADILSNRIRGSGLSLKLFFLHDSLLFQNTIGAFYRHSLKRHMQRSLANLVFILSNAGEQQRILSSYV